MSLSKQHELHTRRYGRYVGVGLMLAGVVAIIFGLTVVKVTNEDFTTPSAQTVSQ